MAISTARDPQIDKVARAGKGFSEKIAPERELTCRSNGGKKVRRLVTLIGLTIPVVFGVYLVVRGQMAADLPPRDMLKAQQPISATLEVLGEHLPGARVTLALTAKTQVPADNVELRLDLPQPLVLIGGEPSWKGSLQKGGQASLRVDVMIRGAAIATFPHAKAVAVDEAVINPTASVPGQARKVRRNSRGEPILEFPANTRVRRR